MEQENDLIKIWNEQNSNFNVMYQVLWDDVVETGRQASESKSIIDCSRRSCVRACYAFSEGVATRSEALAPLGRLIRGDATVPEKQVERMMHAIIRQVPENRTDPAYRDKRRFSERVKESFKTISSATGHPFDLSKCSVEWQKFNGAVTIRDRIMHPHIAEDLRITDSEMVLVLNSTTWFHNMFSDVVLGKDQAKKAV